MPVLHYKRKRRCVGYAAALGADVGLPSEQRGALLAWGGVLLPRDILGFPNVVRVGLLRDVCNVHALPRKHFCRGRSR